MNPVLAVGLDTAARARLVGERISATDPDRVICVGPAAYRFPIEHERVRWTDWDEVIQYKHFYPILQETSANTLLVVNECLRTSDRHCLTYNCVRQFLNQTRNVVVLQTLPVLESIEDVMVLVDFVTRSQWKRHPFRADMLECVDVAIVERPLSLSRVIVETTARDRDEYDRQKRELFASIGGRDPHLIPRTLHLVAGKTKARSKYSGAPLVGRNNRFKLPRMTAYAAEAFAGDETVFEFPHGWLPWVDFIAKTGQSTVRSLVTDLKVDQWYADRAAHWMREVERGYAALRKE